MFWLCSDHTSVFCVCNPYSVKIQLHYIIFIQKINHQQFKFKNPSIANGNEATTTTNLSIDNNNNNNKYFVFAPKSNRTFPYSICQQTNTEHTHTCKYITATIIIAVEQRICYNDTVSGVDDCHIIIIRCMMVMTTAAASKTTVCVIMELVCVEYVCIIFQRSAAEIARHLLNTKVIINVLRANTHTLAHTTNYAENSKSKYIITKSKCRPS